MENEQKNRRARCSGAPCEYTFFLQNIAQRFKQMDSEEKNGGLIAAARPIKMHVCGTLPTAGKMAAKKIGGLIAAGRFIVS